MTDFDKVRAVRKASPPLDATTPHRHACGTCGKALADDARIAEYIDRAGRLDVHAAIEREAYAKVRAAVEGIPSIREVFGVTFDHHQVPQEAVLAAIDALMEENDGR